jgi:hypothetical protein
MGGSDGLTIGNNGSLILYSGGTSATISGNGIVNKAGKPEDFIMYCAPTVTTFTFDGNGEFIGVVCAPNADITMNGGGTLTTTSWALSLSIPSKWNGHFGFHFDEALLRIPYLSPVFKSVAPTMISPVGVPGSFFQFWSSA